MPANVASLVGVLGVGDVVGAAKFDCSPLGSIAITSGAWDGDNGGESSSGSSKSGVRERPSSSLKLFSRGMSVEGWRTFYFDQGYGKFSNYSGIHASGCYPWAPTVTHAEKAA